MMFDPCTYFDGSFKASGMFIDRKGIIRRRFDVNITATPQDNGFILDEDFLYDDGETETRQWIVIKNGDHQFTGVAGG
ncbi:MAG: DUF3833 family protein, partial [Candidatus Puniceispirillales bacterium]